MFTICSSFNVLTFYLYVDFTYAGNIDNLANILQYYIHLKSFSQFSKPDFQTE